MHTNSSGRVVQVVLQERASSITLFSSQWLITCSFSPLSVVCLHAAHRTTLMPIPEVTRKWCLHQPLRRLGLQSIISNDCKCKCDHLSCFRRTDSFIVSEWRQWVNEGSTRVSFSPLYSQEGQQRSKEAVQCDVCTILSQKKSGTMGAVASFCTKWTSR